MASTTSSFVRPDPAGLTIDFGRRNGLVPAAKRFLRGTIQLPVLPPDADKRQPLAEDLPALWHADSTSLQHRQAIARLTAWQASRSFRAADGSAS